MPSDRFFYEAELLSAVRNPPIERFFGAWVLKITKLGYLEAAHSMMTRMTSSSLTPSSSSRLFLVRTQHNINRSSWNLTELRHFDKRQTNFETIH